MTDDVVVNETVRDVDVEKMLFVNERRKRKLVDRYNPVKGRKCCSYRRKAWVKWEGMGVYLPVAMLDDPEYGGLSSEVDYVKLRCKHDFEYWAAKCVVIKHKLTGCDVAFVLNRPQRRVVDILEADRIAGRPLRLIMLKARQWGGSTLVQMYFAWIQCVHRRNWNSLICAHVTGTAAVIRGMYSKMLASYPHAYWTGDEPPKLKSFEGSKNIREIAGRNNTITLTSSFAQEATRGLDCAMAHLTEVAFWRDTNSMTPEAFVMAVCAGIPMVPYSFIVLESTANGVGNYFHKEWLRAVKGKSDKHAVFVPWYEIEMCRQEVADAGALIGEMDEYEWHLWDNGLTLEMIQWYHTKRMSVQSQTLLRAEYPATPDEAFCNTGAGVFSVESVEALRQGCRPPMMVGEVRGMDACGPGALDNVSFKPDSAGKLSLWRMPVSGCMPCRYITVVDVGGRSADSDYSVIAVIDAGDARQECRPEVVAQWRGHIDHDLLGWKAVSIAKWYGNALLVVESNTLESEGDGRAAFILEQIDRSYRWVYSRGGVQGRRVGFHTNRQTKTMIITELIAKVRDGGYVEADELACNEMLTYQQAPSGAYAAISGEHDDVLMTRAIGLYVAGIVSKSANSVGSDFHKRRRSI